MKTKSIFLVLFLIATIMTSPILIAEVEGDFYPGELTVCFSSDYVLTTRGDFEINYVDGIAVTPFEWLNDLAQEFQITTLERKYQIKYQDWNFNGQYPANVFRLRVSNHSRTNELLDVLEASKNVLFAEPSAINRLLYTPDDPSIPLQYALTRVQAFDAWDIQTGSPDVVIGIVDSGVKWNHVDLEDNMWINTAELPGMTINWSSGTITGGDGIDNDGNGFIDDVLGWDFYSVQGGGQDNNPFQNLNGHWHGTHVAGIAAGVGDNGIGMAGLAFTSKMVATKHSPYNVWSNSVYEGYAGVYYMVNTGIPIINCSWGGAGNANEANLAGNYARDHGSLIIAAAGNNNSSSIFYPAGGQHILAVASTTVTDTKAGTSNFGTWIDVSAPGDNIYSTIYTSSGVDTYEYAGGTSMASPLVAGLAALILSQNPGLTPDELTEIIKESTDPIDHLNPSHAGLLGTGRVNAFTAVTNAIQLDFDLIANNISGATSVSVNTPNVITVTIRNRGTEPAIGYVINLMQTGIENPIGTISGVDLAPQENHEFTFLWTPIDIGIIQLYGEIVWDIDENPNNNQTKTHNVNVLPQGMNEIVVGNPGSTSLSNESYVNYNYHDSISQTIYYENELIPGTIYQMTVRFTGATQIVPAGIVVKLYMTTTTQSTFSSNTNWIPFANFTEVFSGPLPVNSLGTYNIEIILDTPFEYEADNLVVMAIKDHNGWYGQNNRFQYTPISGQNRTIHWRSDTAGSPPTNPFPTATGRLAGITNASFLIQTMIFAPPINLEANTDFGVVNLVWDAPDLTMENEFFSSQNGGSHIGHKIYRDGAFLIETTNTFYTDTDVEHGVLYNYWVTAVYSDPSGESAPSNVVSIRTPDNLLPPSNLHVELIDESVVFTWEAPSIEMDNGFDSGYRNVATALSLETKKTNTNDQRVMIDNNPLSIRNYQLRNRAFLNYRIYRNQEFLVETTSLSYSDEDIALDNKYIYSVSAVYHSGESESPEVSIILPIFNEPLNLQANDDEGIVFLSWEEPLGQNYGDLLGYHLYRAIEEESFELLSANISASIFNFIDDDVEYYTEYSYFLIALYGGDINGISEPSETVSILLEERMLPPTELTFDVDKYEVTLNWTAPNSNPQGFIVYRGDDILTPEPITETTYIDIDVPVGIYIYKVFAVYIGGESEHISVEVEVEFVSEKDDSSLPLVTELLSNFPNPFNPETTISFNIAEESIVSIDIFNIRGQRVRRLYEGFSERGTHAVVWNGRDDNGRDLGSGLYFYQLVAGEIVQTRRMVLLK
ncbi:MAG: S8 family serine peptidase [Candidatus Cloacimonetes bacterium]|nr:S8 family serine peptidase [Candidatus Cloacimonadota bacterium]